LCEPDGVDISEGFDRRWRIVEIGSPDGATVLSADLNAWLELESTGRFAVSDSVNVASGDYECHAGGIRLEHLVSTLVGYDGRDPARNELLRAVAAVLRADVTIQLHADGDSLVLTAPGYTLTCTVQPDPPATSA
jgi:hypothetical protein